MCSCAQIAAPSLCDRFVRIVSDTSFLVNVIRVDFCPVAPAVVAQCQNRSRTAGIANGNFAVLGNLLCRDIQSRCAVAAIAVRSVQDQTAGILINVVAAVDV